MDRDTRIAPDQGPYVRGRSRPQPHYAPTTLRLLTLQTRIGGTTFQDREYTYTNGGNVTAITDRLDASHSQSFPHYDDRDRLREAQGHYGTHAYTYDALGNPLTKAE